MSLRKPCGELHLAKRDSPMKWDSCGDSPENRRRMKRAASKHVRKARRGVYE